MCYKLITEKGHTISRSSVWPISPEHTHGTDFQQKHEEFNPNLHETSGDRMAGILPKPDDPKELIDTDTPYYEAYQDDTNKDLWQPEADEYPHDGYDKLISV